MIYRCKKDSCDSRTREYGSISLMSVRTKKVIKEKEKLDEKSGKNKPVYKETDFRPAHSEKNGFGRSKVFLQDIIIQQRNRNIYYNREYTYDIVSFFGTLFSLSADTGYQIDAHTDCKQDGKRQKKNKVIYAGAAKKGSHTETDQCGQ